ncbi:hypothetical protein D3C85_1823320 [compost metagenome]
MLNGFGCLLSAGGKLLGGSGYIVRHLLHTDNHFTETCHHRPEIVGEHAELILAECSNIL